MIITDIKKSVRFRKLHEVYIDCEYAFSLYENELKFFGIEISGKVDSSALCRIYKKLGANATGDVLKFLSRADLTKKMAEDKLRQKKYPEEIINNVLEELCKKGYINDCDYAHDFVRAAVKKDKGKKYIEFELKKRGIDDETIEKLICEFYGDVDVFKVAEKKFSSILKGKEAPDYKDFCKLRDYLIRSGFGYEEISDVLSRVKGNFYD